MPRHRPLVVLVAATTLSIAIGSGFALNPATAAPAKKESSGAESAAGRVIPLPAGKWAWSAGFGVAGPMWSSGHHTGQDFSATAGTPILAAAAGIVIFVGNGGPYGNLTQIQHPDGVQTWYAHQSEFRVKVGDKVTPGRVIGAVGATGNTTGPHLHFEVRIGGAMVDPRAWLGECLQFRLLAARRSTQLWQTNCVGNWLKLKPQYRELNKKLMESRPGLQES